MSPLYEYECASCDAVETDIRKVEDRDRPFRCPSCDCMAYPIISKGIAATVQGGTHGPVWLNETKGRKKK